ncbi:membrane protein insertion efficiency factor YidD [bacterium B17]|nr:membrane protein insertion efficiency factor YidD [bacterium B17]
MSGIAKRILILLVRAYQVVLSPFFGNCCRFYPCCSSYCITAINRHGLFRGLWLFINRILRCNPFNYGGVDFVQGFPTACHDGDL